MQIEIFAEMFIYSKKYDIEVTFRLFNWQFGVKNIMSRGFLMVDAGPLCVLVWDNERQEQWLHKLFGGDDEGQSETRDSIQD